LPGVVLGLSIAGPIALLCVGVPFLILLIVIAVIKILQRKKPSWLPRVMRDWKWLPLACRSLEPYDRQFAKCACCKKCRPAVEEEGPSTAVSVEITVSSDSLTKDSS
jgi:sodium-dependent phosphate cotransporter